MHRNALQLGLALMIAVRSGGIAVAAADPPAPRTVGDPAANAAPAAADRPLADQPLSAGRLALLDLAFETAGAIPVEPHVRDRARAQEAIVGACLDLAQPTRAASFAERMGTWRRGVAYADIALFAARDGYEKEARRFAAKAKAIAETTDEWRRDRILARVAQTLAWLGDEADARSLLGQDVVPSEQGKIEVVKAKTADADRFDEQVAILDVLIRSGNFDLIRTGLDGFAELHRRFYTESAKRTAIEDRIRGVLGTLPLDIRVATLLRFADAAIAHEDKARALELAREAQALVDGNAWSPEGSIAANVAVAEIRHRAGEKEGPRSQIEAALRRFDADRERIVEVDRAAALRTIAAGLGTMQDPAAALAVYRRAVEEGASNPNARPRALDLAATCASLAQRGVEPDDELLARLRSLREGLVAPW